jgi:mycothiol synthase
MFQPKMRNPTFTIRNYHSRDFERVVQLVTEVQELGRSDCSISLSDLFESLRESDSCLKENLFIAERSGEIVGYAEVKPELNIGRAVLSWLVHPRHRSGALTVGLVDRAVYRTRALGIMTLHVNISQDSFTAKRFLTRRGFTFVRRFLELRLDLTEMVLPEISKSASPCRPSQPGEEGRLTQLQNRSFAGTWGFNPNTIEEITYRISLPHSSRDDIFLIFDSDKPVGYCWTRTESWKNKAPGEGTGRIYMLGVDPDYRGRGLGRQLLLVGLSYLKSKGLRGAVLTVDSKNKAARILYTSVGFKPWKSSLWYEKRLD